MILGVNLPDVNIHDLCDEMHSSRDVFVLMLTTNLNQVGNADGYLRKPFNLGESSARVAAVFNRGDDDDQWRYKYIGRR